MKQGLIVRPSLNLVVREAAHVNIQDGPEIASREARALCCDKRREVIGTEEKRERESGKCWSRNLVEMLLTAVDWIG